MMDETAHVQDLVAAYVLGAVTPEEAAQVEEHLTTCADCRQLVRELREVEQRLPALAGGLAPPPALKARLMAIVAEEAGARTSRDEAVAVETGAVAPAPIVETARPAPVSLRTTPWFARRGPGSLSPLLAVAAVLLLAVAAFAAWQAFFTGHAAKPSYFAMKGTAALPSVRGTLTYHEDTHTLQVALRGLKSIPPGRVYELWLVRLHGQTIVGARGIGVLRPSPRGQGRLTLTVPDVTAYNLAGLTIERAPRSATPHFPIVAEGAIVG